MEQPDDSPKTGWRGRLSQAQQIAATYSVIVVAAAKTIHEIGRMLH